MKSAALLVVLLSNQGYWFGGQHGSIAVSRAIEAKVGGADLVWELSADTVRIDGGTTPFVDAAGQPTTVSFRLPEVRTRTELTWSYRLVSREQKRVLDESRHRVTVFPNDLLRDAARRIGGERIVVVGGGDDLASVLKSAVVPFEHVNELSTLRTAAPDVVLVAADSVGDSPFAQGPLLALAKSGCSVMLFQQTAPKRLIEYSLAPRAAAATMRWRADHPLLRDLEPDDVRSWFATGGDVAAIQLPANEPALEIVHWPREAPGHQPAPIDALLVSKSAGDGRIVLCQLPLGRFATDPRSQLLLRNALDYLVTRPEPTPPPNRRPRDRERTPASAPTIGIPSGVGP